MKIAIHPQKNILHEVQGISRIAGKPQAEVVHLGLMAPDKIVPGPRRTLEGSADQGIILICNTHTA